MKYCINFSCIALLLSLCYIKAQNNLASQKDVLIITDSLVQTSDSIKQMNYNEISALKIQSKVINENLSLVYEKPKFFDFLTKLPKDFASIGKSFIQKENLIWFGASVGTTAAIIPFDQDLINGSNEVGKNLGWPNDNSYEELGPFNIIPQDIPSGIYYVGNGGAVILGSISLFTYGLFTNDYRAYQTSSQLVEGIFATGLVTQFLKRATGRESPNVALENGNRNGAWRPFPSFSEYQNHTPTYDAMPSGHVTLFTASLMIMAENYPEYKWIKPLGFSFLGVLMFEMMATNVHWASDYPLAIFLGYIIGKNIAKNRIKRITNNQSKNKFKPKIGYSFSSENNFKSFGITLNF